MATYSVLGAGSGGQALAGVLKQLSHKVKIWSRSSERIQALQKAMRIEIHGAAEFKETIDLITTDIGEAVEGAKIIFVVVPANAHLNIANLIAPYIHSNQTIVLNPGRTLGSLEFKNALIQNGTGELPIILETQSLFCACREINPGRINILSFKKDNFISCIPMGRFKETAEALSSVYRNMIVAPSPLYTGLENIGAILHPAPVILNTGWIESRDIFFPHYYYGISKSVARFLEKVDIERLRIADQYGVRVRSLKTWHEDNYGYRGETLYETLQKNSSYASIDAPHALTHRYVTEDIPTGLVPISELGRAANIETPLIDMVIELGSQLLEIDFRAEGRNLKKMGIEGKTVKEINQVFEEY